MELAPSEGGAGMRVTFKDYGFFVPTDSAGAKARVQGTLKVAELSAAQAEHLRAEGGSMSAGAQREVRLVATGVELRR
jgi:3-oxoacyl-(acyl-carrier-protein) synthase